MRGKDGAEASRMYYKRNGWRDHGQARFFDSPEALIVAVGGTLARKVGPKKLWAQAGQGWAGRKPQQEDGSCVGRVDLHFMVRLGTNARSMTYVRL